MDVENVSVPCDVLILSHDDDAALCVKARPSRASSHLLDGVHIILCPARDACHAAILDCAFDDDEIGRQVGANRESGGGKEAEESASGEKGLDEAAIFRAELAVVKADAGS